MNLWKFFAGKIVCCLFTTSNISTVSDTNAPSEVCSFVGKRRAKPKCWSMQMADAVNTSSHRIIIRLWKSIIGTYYWCKRWNVNVCRMMFFESLACGVCMTDTSRCEFLLSLFRLSLWPVIFFFVWCLGSFIFRFLNLCFFFVGIHNLRIHIMTCDTCKCKGSFINAT